MLLSIALFLGHIMCYSTYKLVDLHQNTPVCYENVENHLGRIEISHNIIGDEVIIRPDFSSIDHYPLCALCEKDTTYCQTKNVVMANETEIIRARILVFDANLTSPRLLYHNLHVSLYEATKIIWRPMLPLCGETVHFVVVLTLVVRNVTLYATPLDFSYKTGVLCNASYLYEKIGLDCHTQPYIFPLRYTLDNCLLHEKGMHQAKIPHITTTNFTTLYWYKESLITSSSLPGGEYLCGLPFHEHLLKSGLYHYVCGNQDISLKPWYQLALSFITWRLNHGNLYDSETLRVLDLLERNCDKKESMHVNDERLLIPLQHTLGNNDTLCEVIKMHYNNTTIIPYYKQWYYEHFKTIFLPNHTMGTKVIVFLVFMSLFVIACVFMSLFTCFYRYRARNTPLFV